MFVTPSHYKNILREQEALRKENRELRVENDTLVAACKYCREVINNKTKTLESKLDAARGAVTCKDCKFEKHMNCAECHDCARYYLDHFEALKDKNE